MTPRAVLALASSALAIVIFAIVNGTYFYSDDFFLMSYVQTLGPSWDVVAKPIYGHFVPGMLWLYWVIGEMGGLGRLTSALVVALLVVATFWATVLLARLPGGPPHLTRRRVVAAALGIFTAVLIVPVIYLARGGATLPIGVALLFSIAVFITAMQRRSVMLSVAAAVLCATGLLFWELAAANFIIIPLIAWALVAGREQVSMKESARRTPRSVGLGFGITAVLALALYAWNYIAGGFGSGVPRPSTVDWAVGTLRGIPSLLLPSIGGGPVPTVHQVLPHSNGDFTQPQLFVPLLIGIALFASAFMVRHLRPLVIIVGTVALFQCATIVFARWEFSGAGTVSELRYAADLAPFYVLVLANLWLAVLTPASGRLDMRHVALGTTLAAALITTVVTAWSYIGQFGGADRANYVAVAEDAVSSVPASALLLPGPVPSYLGWLPTPFDNSRSVLYASLGQARWSLGTAPALVLNSRGRPVLAHRRDDATVSAPAGACVGVLAVPTPVAAEPVLRTAVVAVRARRAGPGTLSFAGAPVSWSLPAGDSTVVFQTYGAIGPVATSPGVCLLSSRSFVAAP
jgi:hypothetical protein